MSVALMSLAFKTTLPPTQKFVLVALCDSANDQGECYPSVPALAIKCSLGERTVQEAIAVLEGFGFVRREFRRGRSTVYWLDLTPAAPAPLPRSSRTPAAAAPVQEPHHPPAAAAPTGAPAAPPPPQEPHLTPAAAAPRTVREPSVEPSQEPSGKRKRAPAVADLARPDDVTEQVWQDWCALRKAKRATVSETVVAGARDEAALAGLTLDRFLAVWCMRGSQGLQASWLKPEERGAPRHGVATTTSAASRLAETQRLLGHHQQDVIDA